MTRNLRYKYLVMAIIFLNCFCSQIAQSSEQATTFEKNTNKSEHNSFDKHNLPTLNEDSTLSDYLTYAALSDPGLEAAFYRWKSALQRACQVKSLPDPMFTYAYFISEVETRVGPQRQKFGISQTFPWFGKLSLREDKAIKAANALRQKYESTKLKVFYRVIKAYYEYYYIGRSVALTKENIDWLSFLETIARTNFKTGKTSHADVIKTQVELGKLENRLQSLRELRRPMMAKFNAALNRPHNLHLPLPDDIPKKEIAFSDERLFAWLKKENPKLKALDYTIAKERTQIDLARKNFFPDITFGVEYIETDDTAMPGVNDSGKDPVVTKISINLPIWRNKYRAAKKEAKARHTAAKKDRIEMENNLLNDLEMAIYYFRNAERKIDLYKDMLIPKTEQCLKITMEAFSAGTSGFLDLIDVQRTLLEFNLSFERALVDREQRIGEIEMLAGRSIWKNSETGLK